MAFMYVFDAPNLTKAQYNATREIIGWEDDPPPGALGHAAAFRDGDKGAVGFDLWQSQEQAEAYYRDHLLPALAAAKAEPVEPREVLELERFAYLATATQYATPRALTPA
jgi:hypothetical protein